MRSARAKAISMIRRSAPPALGALAVVFASAAIGLVPLNGEDLWSSDTVGSVILALSFAGMGWLLTSRRPGHAVGWIFLISGFFNSLNALSSEYPRYAAGTGLPGAELLAWMAPWVWGLGAAGFPLLLLLFPTGRPPTPRWRLIAWVTAAGVTLVVLPQAVMYWPLRADLVRTLDIDVTGDLADRLVPLGMQIMGVAFLAAIASLVVRFRRARGEERQQLKWLVFAGVLTFAVILTASPASPLELARPMKLILSNLALLALPSIPAGAAIAILKYRLYDIDVVINRTLVYAVLTAILAATYLGSVVVFQGVLSPFGRGSDFAVAGSTLAVAALFGPLRRRVQAFIDRRFYRPKYDAARTVAEFSARLRDEVDLDQLSNELIDVVRDTMHPTQISLWLRGDRNAEMVR